MGLDRQLVLLSSDFECSWIMSIEVICAVGGKYTDQCGSRLDCLVDAILLLQVAHHGLGEGCNQHGGGKPGDRHG
jgi:hypothetical protein